MTMDEALTRPEWLIWFLQIAESWPYVIFRIFSIVVGLGLFVWGFIRGVVLIFTNFTASKFLIAFAIAFGSGVFGWGWPAYVGMRYHLTNCDTAMLFIGRAWGEMKCPGYPRFVD